jgi:hypothetical protein
LQETLRRTDAMHLEAKNRAAQSEMKVLVLVASARRDVASAPFLSATGNSC